MLRADLHLHTQYSFDCLTPLDGVMAACVARGISCVAIADHATTDGAKRLRDLAPFQVIVAEEVLTPAGEIMGMFLSETVPSPLPVAEAVERIKAQGGLVCIPHPFDRLRGGSALQKPALLAIMQHVDIVEGFNARSLTPGVNARAQELGRKYGKPLSAGSDAHAAAEIGAAYVEIAEFTDPQGFLAALRAGKIVGHLSNPLVRVATRLSRRPARPARG